MPKGGRLFGFLEGKLAAFTGILTFQWNSLYTLDWKMISFISNIDRLYS